jgi:hypothetical protein
VIVVLAFVLYAFVGLGTSGVEEISPGSFACVTEQKWFNLVKG